MYCRIFSLIIALAWSTASNATTYTQQGYFFTSDPHNRQSFADGINDSGQIVGNLIDTDYRTKGFIYSGGNLSIFQYASNNITIFSGINNNGDVVGTYQSGNAVDVYHGLVYSNGTHTTLDHPAVKQQTTYPYGTRLTGIDDSGRIVGTYSNGYVNGTTTFDGGAFVYFNGSFTALDAPAYGNDPKAVHGTYFTGTNDLGQAVGWYYDSSYVKHSFIYSSGSFTDLPLPNYVDASDSSFPQTLDNWVSDINNNGQILGTVEYSIGIFGTVVLTPVPEPNTWTQFIAGIALLLVFVRKGFEAR